MKEEYSPLPASCSLHPTPSIKQNPKNPILILDVKKEAAAENTDENA